VRRFIEDGANDAWLPAIAVDNAEHRSESGANASIPIAGLGASGGLD